MTLNSLLYHWRAARERSAWRCALMFLYWLIASLEPCSAQRAATESATRLDLRSGWFIQSSAKVPEKGDALSTPGPRAGWYPATVPTTVLAALVADHVYPDPYYGMNLRAIPGTGYPIGQNFSNRPMSPDSPFAVSWWFRKEFRLPARWRGRTLWLDFDSLNYRANIWLNGHPIATADQAAGMYRMFEFDVSQVAKPDGANTLAVEVFPPTPTDLSITFVDWNPLPPDKDMGLVRDVYLRASGPIAVRNTQVVSKLDPSFTRAALTVSTDLQNSTDRSIDGVVRGSIGAIVVAHRVQVAPHAAVHVEFSPREFPQLNLEHPDLWWPYAFGAQPLYHLQLAFTVGNSVSDRAETAFGIREIASEIDAQQHRLFKINGKRILIRGGGWTQDMMLRFAPLREEDELRYVRDMNLNTVRLEGKMMNDHFFETCDRLGILVMAGWCCCSYWERWRNWQPNDYVIAGESLRDQVRRIRNHPSDLVWLYGSDNSPNPQAEAVYLKVLQDECWPNPYISSAAERTTVGAGPTGVKMTGPYDYVAPDYWLQDRERGGAFGFNTETSPGPAIPEKASLEAMLPKEHLWPIDDFWNYHAGGYSYRDVGVFTTALEARYGKASDLDDYLRKSQAMTYEGERAMFEAFGCNKYLSTGVIQWMINNAWPSLIWHLFDYYLRPGGGYFGAKKACEPLHVQYSYDDRSVVVVNSLYTPFAACTVACNVYNLDLSEKFAQSATVDVAPDSSTRVLALPDIVGLSRTYFVKLALRDQSGRTVSTNFYWLSTQPDESDWAAGDGRYTPVKTFADFTDLTTLPPAAVKVSARSFLRRGSDRITRMTVENLSTHLAFGVRLRLRNADGVDIEPILWSDNYFALMPGERREITATYRRSLVSGSAPRVAISGWNVPETATP